MGEATPKGEGAVALIYYLAKFAENCMKMKEIGPGKSVSKILLCR